MLTIVWDVDDVLNDLMYQWFSHSWLQERPECKFSYSQLSANPPNEVLGISRDEYLDSLDRFRKTEIATDMRPNQKILKWLRDYGSQFRHIALTARPLETAPDVAHWVLRYFGAWIRCFGLVHTRPNNGLPVYDKTKGEFLTWLGCGNILVDDSEENIRQAQALGLKTLLYPQPWNGSSLDVDSLLDNLTEMAVRS